MFLESAGGGAGGVGQNGEIKSRICDSLKKKLIPDLNWQLNVKIKGTYKKIVITTSRHQTCVNTRNRSYN